MSDPDPDPDPDPDRRIVERTLGRRSVDGAGATILSVPLVYGTGLLAGWLLGLQLYLAMAASSLLAAAVLADALFLNPPTP